MRYIELNGTAKEIGRQHGRAFSDDIKKYYEFYCLRCGKTPDTLHPSIRHYVETHLPEIAQEIEGIAEGSGLRYDEILTYNHFSVISGCTAVFFRNTPDGPILAQNLDCGIEEQQAVLISNVKPEKGYAFLNVSFVGTVWAGNAINETGLCMAGVSAHQSEYRTENGTSYGIIDRTVIQYGSNVHEALDIMNTHPNIGKVGCRLFLDGQGKCMITEGTPTKKFGTIVTDDFCFSTGLFTSGKVTAKNELNYIRPKIARKETINRMYESGEITFTVDGMKQLLGHHAPDPGSVCRHNRDFGECTQSARIMIRDQRKLLICDGPPCCSEFEEFTLRKNP